MAHNDSNTIDPSWTSISDFFSRTAEDFFTVDVDLLQDDFFHFAGQSLVFANPDTPGMQLFASACESGAGAQII
jgi:tRNA U34 5-methylaminomethyl-2-thiouridine-forming methyltransferase MnmC